MLRSCANGVSFAHFYYAYGIAKRAAGRSRMCADNDGERVYREAIDRLCARFGSIVDQSEPCAMKRGYYASEMGGELMKQLLCFAGGVSPNTLYAIKWRR